jgi:S-formylglutathione hydrolase FrmB
MTMSGAATGQGDGPTTTARGPAETCVPAAIPFDAEDIKLTGRWSADDGSIYYVRHVGDKVFFTGMTDYEQQRGEIGREGTSVGMGTLKGTEIDFEVADVPRGNVWNAGELRVRISGDADGNLRAQGVPPQSDQIVTFRPCRPEANEIAHFARPFSYAVPFGMASATWPGRTDLQVMTSPDVPEAGISFWVLGPGLGATCSAPDVPVPSEGTPESIVEYLRAIPELQVSEPSTATVAGQPALVVDVETAPGAAGCGGDGYVRLWKESGEEASVTSGRPARLLLVDADGATFAAELWGSADADAWWPMAQGIVDSISLVPASPATVGEPAANGARVVRVAEIDDRTRDLTIESPSVGYARVRLLLPDGYVEGDPDAAWPTLYLLHGAWDDYTSWTRETDVAEIPELRDVLVVMPDAGQLGFYTDWSNGGAGGQPAWETFHTVELPQLIETNWGGGTDRVVAGLSMGGFGALSYAARHPDMFKAAASYSGVAHTLGPDFFVDELMWGDKTEDLAIWEAHDPVSQAADLEGTDVFISYGEGGQGPLDEVAPPADDLEPWIKPMNDALVARLEELGIPATVDAYGAGSHTWPYWERGLHDSLPVLLGALAE